MKNYNFSSPGSGFSKTKVNNKNMASKNRQAKNQNYIKTDKTQSLTSAHEGATEIWSTLQP